MPAGSGGGAAQPPQPAEGRQWWLQLQQQRRSGGAQLQQDQAAATAAQLPSGSPAEQPEAERRGHRRSAAAPPDRPPDLPVRGFVAPPSRAECRLIATREMQGYYKEQRRWVPGTFFRYLGLVQAPAGGRGSDAAPLQLASDDGGAAPQRRPQLTLKGAVRRGMAVQQLVGMADAAKAAVWARERTQELSTRAAEQLRQQQEQAAAAEAAFAAATARAAAAATRQLHAGPAAGNAFAAVVQQAQQAQHQQGTAVGTPGAAGAPGGARGRGRGAALPSLQLQKLTQHWKQAAAASLAASGEQTAREHAAAAQRRQLKEQWAAVRKRLPRGDGQP